MNPQKRIEVHSMRCAAIAFGSLAAFWPSVALVAATRRILTTAVCILKSKGGSWEVVGKENK
jgi:hypothetical protein